MFQIVNKFNFEKKEKNLHFENDDNGGGGRWPSVLWSFKWIITSIDGDDGEIETV